MCPQKTFQYRSLLKQSNWKHEHKEQCSENTSLNILFYNFFLFYKHTKNLKLNHHHHQWNTFHALHFPRFIRLWLDADFSRAVHWQRLTRTVSWWSAELPFSVCNTDQHSHAGCLQLAWQGQGISNQLDPLLSSYVWRVCWRCDDCVIHPNPW